MNIKRVNYTNIKGLEKSIKKGYHLRKKTFEKEVITLGNKNT